MSVKILLLEDDPLFNETLQDFLEEEGFAADVALDPYTALDLCYEKRYDLYLFDVNLPYESGFDLLQKLRQSGDTTPTIFLTSRHDKVSLSQGFGVGADDYMMKPIDLEELVLRMGALLRRQVRTEHIVLGDYTLDVVAKQLFYGKKVVEITPKAIALLMLLVATKGAVVTQAYIRDRLWAAGEVASDGAVRVYVTQLKKYFPQQIENIRGIGYKWVG